MTMNKTSRKILKTDNWFIAEKAAITHCLFAVSPIRSITCEMEKLKFPSLTEAGTEYVKDGGNYIFVEKEWKGTAQKYLNIIKENPNILFKIHQEILDFSDRLFKFGKSLHKTNFSKYSNKKLGQLYYKFEFLHNEAHKRRVPAWILETGDEIFSRDIVSYLDKEIKKQKLEFNPNLIFNTLSSPLKDTLTSREKKEFLRIALKLKTIKKLNNEIIKDNLSDHARKYRWLSYGISGPALKEAYFIENMQSVLRKDKNEIEKELDELNNQHKKIQEEQKEILKKLKINKLYKDLIKLAKETFYVKAYSKEALFFGYFCVENLFNEIAKRLDVDLKLLKKMLPWEIAPALLKGEYNKDELERRYNYSLHYVKNGKSAMLTGDEARNFVAKLNLKREEDIASDITEIKGTCARVGHAKGRVKIINEPKELNKMNDGNVLVSHMTDPEIVIAMRKSSAIVTDLGGITCHAAIVSRELGKPCIIGTKIATRVLKDNDLVEVDADKGVVKILENRNLQ